jgi:hypothetical protein
MRILVKDPRPSSGLRPLSIQALVGVDENVRDLATRAANRLGLAHRGRGQAWTLARDEYVLPYEMDIGGLMEGAEYELVEVSLDV